jgi:hypothetical protein
MKWAPRIEALEQAYAKAYPGETPPPARPWVDDCLNRSEKVLTRLKALGLSEENFGQIVALLQRNLNIICRSPGKERSGGCSLRRPESLERLVVLTPEDLRPAVVQTLAEYELGPPPSKNCPLHNWLIHISQQRSRLPPDLAPETMRRILQIHLNEKQDWGSPVCEKCGLERPKRDYSQGRLPDFFPGCPHCGCSEWTWNTLTDRSPFPWKDLLARELANQRKGRGTKREFGFAKPETLRKNTGSGAIAQR